MFLLVGGNSEIGAATARDLRENGQRVVTTTRRAATPRIDELFLDLERLPEDWRPPTGIKAACIFVAMARLAACEADQVGSRRINVTQTLALAEKLIASGVYTLFLSSNQVFDGSRPHVPAEAPPSPVSAYGRQKAETEAVFKKWIAGGAPTGILRLAKVVSPQMALLCGWRESLAKGEAIRAFQDMTMAPTPTALVARAIACMLSDRDPAIAQLTGPRDVSYGEVAEFIAKELGSDPKLVGRVSALDNGMPAGALPRNTTLDSGYLAKRHGLRPPDPLQVVRQALTPENQAN